MLFNIFNMNINAFIEISGKPLSPPKESNRTVINYSKSKFNSIERKQYVSIIEKSLHINRFDFTMKMFIFQALLFTSNARKVIVTQLMGIQLMVILKMLQVPAQWIKDAKHINIPLIMVTVICVLP